jgi:hypothetical protein
MIGRLLEDDDIRKLQQAITPGKTDRPNRSGPASCKAIGGQTMTLVLRKQRAQDRIKGRYSFDWGEDD